MAQDPPFQQFQRALAQHLRDPHHVTRPAGVPARRAAVYQQLLFNNVCGFLDKCFPISRQLLGEARWRRLCRTFYRDWPLHDPLIRHIPREFVAYLAAGEICQPLPAWAAELAHYEWAELAVDIMATAPPAHFASGDLMRATIVLNPAVMSLVYAWPVHRIGPHFRPRKPGATPTHLVVFRDAQCLVKFCEINAITARLLALLSIEKTSGEAALRALADELRHPSPARLIEFGASLLIDLQRQGIVLGTQP